MTVGKNNDESVLCAIHAEHCNTLLEVTDVWLMTSDPAAFVLCIRNKLQALKAHLDLEDTAITRGTAVLLPKLSARE